MATVPLVLVHGHPFDHTMWNPQRAAFSADRQVITPDLRGYGTSPRVPEVTRFEQFAQDIRELLDELDVQACVLAGLSMGGQIVMDCCRQFPERVRGLVLADTFAWTGWVRTVSPIAHLASMPAEPDDVGGAVGMLAVAALLALLALAGYARRDLRGSSPRRRD